METYDNHDKLRMIKHYFIFNMLQQPSCFININKTAKRSSTNIKQENDSETGIPICDKLTMTKFLVILKLLQQPYHNKNTNKTFKNKVYEFHENENADYLESLIPPPPIIIEEKDIDIVIPTE
ncbi:hypothetical protein KPL37_14760 [Clostridium frigoris]|uniref:Uncharacterized protein n=1 Tax=Clostridium frigoris TaxID=205327 RepID=A0ABS6BVN5_9CLOT|nr:hypothetical protein [Clostridium frigoris]MBU3160984.1 hypothetical protein [Clostridium frigoris]